MSTATFHGATYEPKRDGARLNRQLERVRDLMLDGVWRTLGEIGRTVGAPEASVSARLRDLRKPENGGYLVEREHVKNGLFQYRVLPPKKDERQMWLLEGDANVR